MAAEAGGEYRLKETPSATTAEKQILIPKTILTSSYIIEQSSLLLKWVYLNKDLTCFSLFQVLIKPIQCPLVVVKSMLRLIVNSMAFVGINREHCFHSQYL